MTTQERNALIAQGVPEEVLGKADEQVAAEKAQRKGTVIEHKDFFELRIPKTAVETRGADEKTSKGKSYKYDLAYRFYGDHVGYGEYPGLDGEWFISGCLQHKRS